MQPRNRSRPFRVEKLAGAEPKTAHFGPSSNRVADFEMERIRGHGVPPPWNRRRPAGDNELRSL